MDSLEIISTGSYAPSKVISNDDMSKIVDTNNEWIVSRTGIHNRHFVEDEDTTDLAYKAALKALEGIDKSKIGIIIVASITNTYHTPSTACLLQKRLGLSDDVFAFDISAACSGFVYATKLARSLLAQSQKSYALIIGAETLSHLVDFKDRSTCVLFGDGAGAVVYRYKEGLYSDHIGCDGDIESLNASSEERKMHMQGRAVFRFATSAIEECITKTLEKSKLSDNDIDYFIVHQANIRIIAHVYKKMHIDASKFFMNLDEYGNTSGASIPLALDEMNQKGMLKRGMKIMMIGFGGGLTYGANLIEF